MFSESNRSYSYRDASSMEFPRSVHISTDNFQSSPMFQTRKIPKLTAYISDKTANLELSEIAASSHHASLYGNIDMDLVDETTTEVTKLLIEGYISDEDPGLQATSSLFEEFLNAYRNHPGEHEIFRLLEEYENLCSRHVNVLMKITRNLPPDIKFDRTHNILGILKEERNTWRLLRTLYQDRLEVEGMERNEEDMLMDILGKRMSDKEIVENLYERDATVRQNQLVVDWLEKNAAEDLGRKYPNKVECFLQNTVPWENTYHLLTNRTAEYFLSDQQLITELDPDAPLRQVNLKLHDTDKLDETRLLKFMFVYLRSGQLAEAGRLAERFGQPWLSAALEGWRLYHDSNYERQISEGDIINCVEGNIYRDVWKVMCWKTSEEIRVPEYERAMYAALSGNLKALLPVCISWEDYLWAYMKVGLDVRIEQELQTSTQQERSLEQLPSSYWDKMLTTEQIFQELQASTSETVQQENKTHHHVIQKYIILDNLDGLIEEMYRWSQVQPHPSQHLLRFMTHTILFLRMIGRSSREELSISILESYVKELIKKQRMMLIADYTATLPPPQQVLWYAKFLEGIEEMTERQLCLQLAEKVGLDIAMITKTVVENIRSKEGTEDSVNMLTSETTKEDQVKIEAIDWLVFDPSQRSEAIRQANALIRIFVANKKLDAARQVFRKIPPDSIDIIIRQWKRMTGSTELPPEDDNATREYLCFQAYLQAHEAFNDWFEHYHQAKPKEPVKPEKSRFTEWIAYEHRVKQYEADLERWEQSLKVQTKNTTGRIYNLLLFPDGGWLVDQRTEGPIDEARQTQMASLRKLCIPQVCFLLHTVLHSTQQYEECLQLADIITAEKNQLYKEFSRQELENLQNKLCESSLKLLDQNLDPLGYPVQ